MSAAQKSKILPYRLLDSGNGRKLEDVGGVRIERQASLALWEPTLGRQEWQNVHAQHHRSDKGGGHWESLKKIPESWLSQVGPFTLRCKLTSFGHLGFFAEQLNEWEFFLKEIPGIAQKLGRAPKILNLFGYTGCSSLAMAAAGAEVTHVDAAKGIVDWGKENQQLNTQVPENGIRWIVDDCLAFIEREARREQLYDGVVLDPPSYGRGPKKQIFKIEDDILPLLKAIQKILQPQVSLIHFSCHTPGFTEHILRQLVEHSLLKNSSTQLQHLSNEMLIPCHNHPTQSLSSGLCLKYF